MKVKRHPASANDFNVNGVKYEIIYDKKTKDTYIGDGKRERKMIKMPIFFETFLIREQILEGE